MACSTECRYILRVPSIAAVGQPHHHSGASVAVHAYQPNEAIHPTTWRSDQAAGWVLRNISEPRNV